eukprot:6178895-Pleurochrysis_carterae.AAC.3
METGVGAQFCCFCAKLRTPRNLCFRALLQSRQPSMRDSGRSDRFLIMALGNPLAVGLLVVREVSGRLLP